MSSEKTVLVAGGGFAGGAAARKLAADFNVVVVDPKTFFEYVPMAPRNFVDAAAAAKSLAPFPTSGGVTYKQGLLVGLATDGTLGEALLQGGEKVAFDYALLCTGSSYPSGVKSSTEQLLDSAARLQELADIRAMIAAADTVVVVGGGSVGVEVAAEVAEAFPGKKVTIVCSGGLLDRMDPKLQEYAAGWLKQHGVEVLLGERISDWGGLGDGLPAAATLTTDKGRSVRGDLVFKCVGVKPTTGLYAASLGSEQLAPNCSVAVAPTLQVRGWRNVFAVGDCNDVREEKTAALAGLAAEVAAANVLLLEQGKELQTYPQGLLGTAVPPMTGGFTLGTRTGGFQTGSDVQTGAAPAMIRALIFWLTMRVVAGSMLWGFVLGQLKKQVVKVLAKEASKARAAAA